MSIFYLDGTTFKFKDHETVEQAYDDIKMSTTAWNRYLEGREVYLLHHLTILKEKDMNWCKVCK
jgi:translation elongation factor P/translation initiation factor 5A